MNNLAIKSELDAFVIAKEYIKKKKIHTTSPLPIIESFETTPQNVVTFGHDNALMIVQIISNGDDDKMYFDGVNINPTFNPAPDRWYIVNKIELSCSYTNLKGQIVGYEFLLE